MSASRERRERQAQRASGIDTSKRVVKSRKAQRQDRVTRWVIGVFIGIIIFTLSALFLMGQGIPQRFLTAAEINGERIRVNELEYHYQMSFQNFMHEYGEMASYFGFNPSQPHHSQYLDQESGYSWRDYFLDETMAALLSTVANAREAVNNGMALGDYEWYVIDEHIEGLRRSAASNGMTMNRMLTEVYGRGMTEAVLRQILERIILADLWQESIFTGIEVTERDIEARYLSNPNEYDLVSFHILQITGDVHHDCEDDAHEQEHSEEEYEAAFADALKRAEAMLARVNANNFHTLALQYGDPSSLEWLTEDTQATITRYVPTADLLEYGELGEWLADRQRRPGDKTVISDEQGHMVLLYTSRTGWPQTGVSVRHILFTFDMYEEEEAEELARDMLREWKAGNATEESFGLLAEEHSGCGSRTSGGLFVDVLRGEMVPEFNDWIFAAARKTGNTDIVRTQFGYHVMYFVEQGTEPIWPRDREQGFDVIRYSLISEAFSDYQQRLTNSYSYTLNNTGLRFMSA